MWFAHVINGFIILTVISCGITSAYIATRSLAALADLSIIHPFFGRKDTMGRPYVSLAISIVMGGGLCYLNCSNQGAVVYGWFSDLVGISTLFQWAGIFISHIRFRRGLKAQGIDYRSLPFRDFVASYAANSTLPVSHLVRRGPRRASSRRTSQHLCFFLIISHTSSISNPSLFEHPRWTLRKPLHLTKKTD